MPPPTVLALTEAPRPPHGLDQYAAERWKTVCHWLIARRLLAEMYLGAVANYCRNYSTVRECDEVLKVEGHFIKSGGQTIRHPAIRVRMEAMKQMQAFEDRFGMNAASSSKVWPAEEKDTDEDAKFFGPRPPVRFSDE